MNSTVKAGSGIVWCLCWFVIACLPSPASALDVLWDGSVGDNNWNTAGNWASDFVPEADPFEEVAVINNGGTARISVNTTPAAAGLILGQLAGDSGTVQILSGGSLTLVDSTGAPTGTANIGLAGTGTLDVRRGGSLTTTLLDVNVGSSVLLGTDAGAGNASIVSTGGMWLDGVTTIRGPGHTFSATGTVTFEGNSQYVSQITGATHTKLTTPGNIVLNGSLRPQFVGVTPAAGNRWDLMDAGAVTGNVALDLSGVNVPNGLVYEVAVVNGGTNGKLVQLQYNALLQLTVNSDTNAASISSPSGVPVNMVGYSIGSAAGSLSATGWNSLDDQNVGGVNVWQEASPTSNSLSELIGNGTASLNVGATAVGIGNPYVFAPAAFGQSPDLAFEYATASGETKQGLVKYTGSKAANNLLLTVDPASGESRLQNSSNFSINLIGYSISSTSGSLQSGNADWSSLQDQGLSGWQESAPTANALSELIASGTQMLALAPGQSYLLGDLFDHVSGVRDLALEFILAGDTAERKGMVAYDTVIANVLGDYNLNGIVDAADYAVWRDKLNGADGSLPNRSPGNTGPISQADYTFWKSRFGATAGAGAGVLPLAAASVPEPSAYWLAVVGAAAVVSLRRPRSLRNSEGSA
jgi:hypothetical protein